MSGGSSASSGGYSCPRGDPATKFGWKVGNCCYGEAPEAITLENCVEACWAEYGAYHYGNRSHATRTANVMFEYVEASGGTSAAQRTVCCCNGACDFPCGETTGEFSLTGSGEGNSDPPPQCTASSVGDETNCYDCARCAFDGSEFGFGEDCCPDGYRNGHRLGCDDGDDVAEVRPLGSDCRRRMASVPPSEWTDGLCLAACRDEFDVRTGHLEYEYYADATSDVSVQRRVCYCGGYSPFGSRMGAFVCGDEEVAFGGTAWPEQCKRESFGHCCGGCAGSYMCKAVGENVSNSIIPLDIFCHGEDGAVDFNQTCGSCDAGEEDAATSNFSQLRLAAAILSCGSLAILAAKAIVALSRKVISAKKAAGAVQTQNDSDFDQSKRREGLRESSSMQDAELARGA